MTINSTKKKPYKPFTADQTKYLEVAYQASPSWSDNVLRQLIKLTRRNEESIKEWLESRRASEERQPNDEKKSGSAPDNVTESAPEIDKRKEKESGADGKRKREHPETENESEAADRPENPGKNRAVPTQRSDEELVKRPKSEVKSPLVIDKAPPEKNSDTKSDKRASSRAGTSKGHDNELNIVSLQKAVRPPAPKSSIAQGHSVSPDVATEPDNRVAKPA